MKFIVEKKGESFMVVNDTTKDVRGLHKTEGDAKVHAQQLQRTHNAGVEMASGRITEKKDEA